jgi:hypothetical protein
MVVLTSQKIEDLYNRYRDINVMFTKEVIAVTGLETKQVHIKCVSDFFPCIVYSSSFEQAKVVINTKSGILENLRQSNNALSLRFCFKHYDTGQQVIFFVQARSMGYVPYNDSPDMAVFSLQFAQHPPDDFIEIMGRVLDANMNATRRKEERIALTPEAVRKLSLMTKEAVVFIEGVPRRCILRDLSFSGAKIVMVGVFKFLEGKSIGLRVDFDDPRDSFNIKGQFTRAEMVEGRKDLVALGISFLDPIPMGYKIRLSDYLNTVKFPVEAAVPAKPSGGAAQAKPAEKSEPAGTEALSEPPANTV